MSDSYFEEGGPFDLRHTDSGDFTMKLRIPVDSYGMIGRECTDESCTPAYFKVKPGTGITEGHNVAYCPYCRRSAAPSDFLTKAQHQYAVDAVFAETGNAVDRMFKRALGRRRRTRSSGMFSIELAYKSDGRRVVPRPVEEELRRDIRCPQCTLEHAVFGLAIWCPDCGADVFETHLHAELDVARRILGAVDDRRKTLGPRVAARDIENVLEDVVSVFEAVLKFIVRRYLASAGKPAPEIDSFLERIIRSQFQNPQLAASLLRDHLALDLFAGVESSHLDAINSTFAKRHPITHNLGIVDRKYLERMRTGELHGRDVRVSVGEVELAIDTASSILINMYRRICGSSPPLGHTAKGATRDDEGSVSPREDSQG
jgi:ribosomal protein L37AE/L43A